MTTILSCLDYDTATGVCTTDQWISQPGLLPPLPAAEGLLVSGAMITMCATAWSLKAIRRYIWPKA